MKLITQPEAGLGPLLYAVRRAKHTVDLVIFRFDLEPLEDELEAAVARGVAVRALIAHTNRGGEERLRKLEQRLMKAGVTVCRTKDDRVRYHGKVLTIDRRRVYILGFNYTATDLRSRSVGVLVRSRRIVKEVLRLFESDVNRTDFVPTVRDLVVSPENARRRLETFLRRARTSIDIYDPQVTDDQMLALLQRTAARGVRVRILGKLEKKWANAGFDARAFPGMRLHVRAIVRDGRRAFVGSQSLRKWKKGRMNHPAKSRSDLFTRRGKNGPSDVMIESEPREDAGLDIPNSWWRDNFHVAVWVLAAGVLLLFLRFAAEAVVPVVLSGMLFYALDPAVDALQRWRVPRVIGAALTLGAVLTGVAAVTFTLRDDVTKVIAELPEGARRLAVALRTNGEPSTLDSLKKATTAINKTAAEAAGAATAPRGVVRVQVEEPVFRTSDYLWSGSMSLAALASQLAMVCFLAYFLLLANDLFKRKLVKHASSTLAGKKITVNVLEAIGTQIERFMLVQIFTSCLVAVATGLALWLLGLQNAAVWGLAAGIFNSVPYFGPFIVTCGLAVVAFLQFGTFGMTAVIAAVALQITALEGWLLTPMLMGRTAHMNRVAVFAGLLFWTWMWGIWGTLLAVPMLMVVKVVCDHVEDFQPVADFLSE